MPKKEVLLFGHSPICKWSDVHVGWADVWITLKDRRETKYFAPCLCTSGSIEMELDIDRSLIKERKESPNNNPHRMRLDDAIKLMDEIRQYEDTMERLSGGAIVIGQSSGEHMENVYSPKDGIDREEAERMLLVYLSSYGYNSDNIKFKWVKPKSGVAWPLP